MCPRQFAIQNPDFVINRFRVRCIHIDRIDLAVGVKTAIKGDSLPLGRERWKNVRNPAGGFVRARR
jgi:hypothetical protein